VVRFFFSWPRKIKVFILEPIYPKRFLKNKQPNDIETKAAIKEMTEFLENQIKEKTKLLYG